MTNNNVKAEKSRVTYSQFVTFVSLLFIAIITTVILVKIAAEILWFQELGYLSVFLTRLQLRISLFIATLILSLLFLLGNLSLAQKKCWGIQKPNPTLQPQSPVLKLRSLLPIVIGFCLLIAVILVYNTQVANQIWRLNLGLPNLNDPLPLPPEIGFLKQFLGQISNQVWQLALIIVTLLALLWKTKFWLKTITIYQAIVLGLVISGNWIKVLRYFYSVPFGQRDPLFDQNISLYVFKLPLWQLADFWLKSLFLYALVAVTLTYLLANNSISEGKFIGFSRFQLRHLYGLGGGLMLVLAVDHWLNRYLLLFSTKGVVYGAGYTDVRIILPKETICAVVSLLIGIWLLTKAIIGSGRSKSSHQKRNRLRWLPFSPIPFLVYFGVYFGGLFLAEVVQNMVVEPNELALEEPYIIKNISETRAAFNLDKIEVKTFNPEGNLTTEVLKKNDLTIDNIRLWDTRPILQTNRQLQQIRPYYAFPDADIDRYTVKESTNSTEKQQVIIAARELDYQLVPKQAQTWVNRHLVYTHGYGFTLSPVNTVAEGGLPYYYIQDIGTTEDPGALRTSSSLIRDSIPIGIPRIYYGQLSDNYVMTNTKVKEFDFPSGDENVYNTYEGKGGINIASPWRKLMFAIHLQDWRMLLTRDFTEETRLLFRRNINERVRMIAPFLYYDRDPYLVSAIGAEGGTNHLHWLIDAYTISDLYPYSDPGENQFNYIRNSVKVLIDAENGHTTFYIADDSDPLIQTWQKIFPDLFQPLKGMPITLKSHIRYPVDLYSTQSERLLTYHMTNPQVFYNREDLWQIPEEIYGNEVLSIEPYYLIMKLPIATSEEFILLHPYTPISRPNLIAWLAARCDGEEYGKLLLYQFPKQKLVYGPDQVEALINQDPVISGQISLWNRQGSRAIQGNLLVIPIEQSLLYVEPLYLEAEKNSLPTLARVIVVYENNIVMANSLQDALEAIFEPEERDGAAIIRPLQEIPLPLLE